MGILQAPTVIWSVVAPISLALNYYLTLHEYVAFNWRLTEIYRRALISSTTDLDSSALR